MIPTARLLWTIFATFLLAVVVSIVPEFSFDWTPIAGLLLGIVAFDAWSIWTRKSIEVERKLMHALSLGTWSDVELTLHNHSSYPVKIEVFDHYPARVVQQGLPAGDTIPARSWVRIRYRVKPIQRGPAYFKVIQIRVISALGLWKKNMLQALESEIKNYPNFSSVMKYRLLATDHRLNQMGILKKRRRGEGLDFHQLREYHHGDSLRQIDWKASARTHKLISKDYQEERDQQIIFLLDCGRRMLAHDDELSHFDHTLNAILLLAHVALRQGDAVGLMTFSGHNRWLPPRKSIGCLNAILNSVYDLQPGLMSPDYMSAAVHLMRKQKKRALVILITNLRDEDENELIPALNMMRRRHLVLLASLRESTINELINREVHGFESALDHAAARHYLKYRREAHRKLDGQGILIFDVEADQLPINLVNRYLDIKGSGRL